MCVDSDAKHPVPGATLRSTCEIRKDAVMRCRIADNSKNVGNNLNVLPNLDLSKKWKFKQQLNKTKRLTCTEAETLQDRRPHEKDKSQGCRTAHGIWFGFCFSHFTSLYREMP